MLLQAVSALKGVDASMQVAWSLRMRDDRSICTCSRLTPSRQAPHLLSQEGALTVSCKSEPLQIGVLGNKEAAEGGCQRHSSCLEMLVEVAYGGRHFGKPTEHPGTVCCTAVGDCSLRCITDGACLRQSYICLLTPGELPGFNGRGHPFHHGNNRIESLPAASTTCLTATCAQLSTSAAALYPACPPQQRRVVWNRLKPLPINLVHGNSRSLGAY